MITLMKKYLFLALIFVSVGAFGQSKEVWRSMADDYFMKEDYASALKYYNLTLDDSTIMGSQVLPYEVSITNQKLKDKDIMIDSTKTVSLSDYLHHQVAMCYHLTYDYPQAVEHFKVTAENGSYPDDTYYYANSLMNNEDYENAINIYNEYVLRDSIPERFRVRSEIAISGCNYAMSPSSVKKEVVVTLADTAVFNKGTAAFAPMFWGSEDRMLFTSAREGGVIIDPTKQQSEYLCDLYWTERMDADTWGEAHNFGRPLNSAQHDASGCFNKNNVIFYTRWSDNDRREQNIHLARMVDLKFYESYKLDSSVNYPGCKSINPFVSKDGKELYFSSNRPGGVGGMDIWKIKIDENGNTIGDPVNLGKPVNTAADEVTPFYHKSTLFFSSDGHKGMGGLDIFKSRFDEDVSFFTPPQNMGAPINSSKDDAYMVWDHFLQYGYFSSDREPCEGGACYDIYKVKNAPIRIFIEGFVYDVDTDMEIPNASITFKDVNYNFDPFVVETDQDGYYNTPLDQDIEVFMKAQKQGYFADAANADTRSITQTTTLTQDFYLQKIPQEEIEIAGIEYDFDSDKLRPKSEEILDELYDFLILNDNLIVQINSHTDERGDEDYNLNLSKRRAKSCVDYLIGKGLPAERLTSKGFGESTPAYLKDANGDYVLDSEGQRIELTPEYIKQQSTRKKKEELHQRNRRTAFKLLGEGFSLESN